MLNVATFIIEITCVNFSIKYVCEYATDKPIEELISKACAYHRKYMESADDFIEDANADNPITAINVQMLEGVDIPDEELN